MQLFISYVLNKVAPIHNPNTKGSEFPINDLLRRAKIRVLRLISYAICTPIGSQCAKHAKNQSCQAIPRQLLCGFDFIPSSHQESIKMPAVC